MSIKCDICNGEIEIVSGGKGKCNVCGLIYSNQRLKEKVSNIKTHGESKINKTHKSNYLQSQKVNSNNEISTNEKSKSEFVEGSTIYFGEYPKHFVSFSLHISLSFLKYSSSLPYI